jgi:hypothetical protein
VRSAAALAGFGAAGLAVSAAFDWFSLDTAHPRCGWTCYSPLALADYPSPPDPGNAFTGLGPLAGSALILVVLAALLAAIVASRPIGHRSAVLIGALIVAVAGAAIVVVRTVTQPGLGRGEPNRLVDVTPAAWIGLGLAVTAALGTALVRRAAHRSAASPHLS